jgi:hypothetical protein
MKFCQFILAHLVANKKCGSVRGLGTIDDAQQKYLQSRKRFRDDFVSLPG